MNNPLLNAHDPLVLQVEARRHDLFAEAAHERLVGEASGKSSQRHLIVPLIASVGRQLSAFGDALQKRFSEPESAQTTQTVRAVATDRG